MRQSRRRRQLAEEVGFELERINDVLEATELWSIGDGPKPSEDQLEVGQAFTAFKDAAAGDEWARENFTTEQIQRAKQLHRIAQMIEQEAQQRILARSEAARRTMADAGLIVRHQSDVRRRDGPRNPTEAIQCS